MAAGRRVGAQEQPGAFGGAKRIHWFEVPAGEKARDRHGEWLPNDTLEAVRAYKVAIKGPLTTPVGGGITSLNVALRQMLDLNFVRDNLDKVRDALTARQFPAVALDDFARADAERRRVIAESDQLNAERNAASGGVRRSAHSAVST